MEEEEEVGDGWALVPGASGRARQEQFSAGQGVSKQTKRCEISDFEAKTRKYTTEASQRPYGVVYLFPGTISID